MEIMRIVPDLSRKFLHLSAATIVFTFLAVNWLLKDLQNFKYFSEH